MLSLAINFIVFMFAAYGATVAVAILIAELAGSTASAMWFSRRHESRAANIVLATCIGVASGVLPFLLWLAVGALATR